MIKKPEQLTCGIKNCQGSRLFKCCIPHQILNSLIGNRPQTATFHTTNVSGQAKKNHRTNNYDHMKSMTPAQFEKHIADLYENKGYQTKLTTRSYDYGVDVIATKLNERIAIQIKMYETRPVNYKDIMYLYAGKDFYDCNKGILITTGLCDPLAIKVANKLGIEIHENLFVQSNNLSAKSNKLTISENDFDDVWQNFIIPLKGQTIHTATGKKNIIIDVNNDYLRRQSSTGEISKIEKQIFKVVYYRLKEKKSITRDEINTEYSKRGSAIIAAVLGRVPFIMLTEKPKVPLTFNK